MWVWTLLGVVTTAAAAAGAVAVVGVARAILRGIEPPPMRLPWQRGRDG